MTILSIIKEDFKRLKGKILYGPSTIPIWHPLYSKKYYRCGIYKRKLILYDKVVIVVVVYRFYSPEKTIAEIRYVLNFETDSFSPLSIILVGQPELWDTLKLRTFEPVFQCISNHYKLLPLDVNQTKEYISHQLKLSESKMLFPDDVAEKIHNHSKGHPRIINSICRHCLIDIESNKLDLVDNSVLDRVLNKLFH